jgi:anti-sigma regulatory factor (Ser/Thr protein kinase)
MHKKFTRTFESLRDIFEFTEDFFAGEGIDRSHQFAVNFAVEELFTNMVKYNAGNPNDILLEIAHVDGELVASLTDFDVDRFDVTEDRDVDVESPLEERKIGGLGLHLIPKMIDSIDYDYADRQSKITFTKALG